MKYPYDASYQPPFPVARVVFYNSEEGLRTAPENALLDTGSDGSLVPIVYLRPQTDQECHCEEQSDEAISGGSI